MTLPSFPIHFHPFPSIPFNFHQFLSIPIHSHAPIGSGYDYRHHPYYSKFAKVVIEE